jgi:hypothetical protein
VAQEAPPVRDKDGVTVHGGLAGAMRGSVPRADLVFRPDPGAASGIMGNALRPARLASDAVAVGYVVVREERFEESLLRPMARYRH